MASLTPSSDRGLRAVALLSTVLGLVACDVTDTGKSGELERGTFYYECDNNPDDGFCDRGELDREFPSAVAVGARFRIDYQPNDAAAYVDLVSGCLDCMERTADGFVMHATGRAPLLVENGLGEIYDVLHMEAKQATELVVRVDDEAWPHGELVLVQGSQHELGATPAAADGTELGGALDYTWEFADESIAMPTSSGERNDVELLAAAVGQTTITVRAGELSFVIPVRVKEVG